jgi:transcriptional regulator with GAF, ATPase, and Fis domain
MPVTDPLEVFREVTVRLCGNLDLVSALAECHAFLKGVLPLDAINLAVYDRGLGAIRFVAGYPNGPDSAGGEVALAGLSRGTRTELEGTALPDVRIVNRPQQDAVSQQVTAFAGDARPISLLIARLVIRGERLGALVLIAEGNDRFLPEHAELVRHLNEPFAIALTNAVRYRELLRLRDVLAEDNQELQRQLSRAGADELVGASFGLREVLELVRKVAPSTTPVLLLGETGVGKEVVARVLHRFSARADGPFLPVNCGAIPEALVDSELFGHERGAFTGATSQKRGRFERAAGGTIFLDEIGELPPASQTRLLRVLQDQSFERVGASATMKADVRIVAATHRDLEAMVRAGTFRQDLWFRLSVFPIRIPALRERKGDIPALVSHFVERKSKELAFAKVPELAPGAIDELAAYAWPGNVRELENVIERALILSQGAPLSFAGLVPRVAPATAPAASDGPAVLLVPLAQVMDEHIRRVLEAVEGRVEGPGGAAEVLDMNPSTLRHSMRRLGIPFGRKAK